MIGTAFKREHQASSQSNHQATVFWPLDLIPKDFPSARVFTYGYDSQVTHWFNGPSMQLDVFSHGESLLNGLEARRRENPDRSIIFIVHSLGGLILKDVSCCPLTFKLPGGGPGERRLNKKGTSQITDV